MIIYLLFSRLRILGDKSWWLKFIKPTFIIIIYINNNIIVYFNITCIGHWRINECIFYIYIYILFIEIDKFLTINIILINYDYRLIIILLSWYVGNGHGDQKSIGDNSHLSVFLNYGEKNLWFSNTVIYF